MEKIRPAASDFAIAVCMALHPRLGQDSFMNQLEENVLVLITNHISFGFMAGIKIGAEGDPGIQEAAKLAFDGDTIIIRSGVILIEWSGHLTITKSIHFTSEDSALHAQIWLDLPLRDANFDEAPILRGLSNPELLQFTSPAYRAYCFP